MKEFPSIGHQVTFSAFRRTAARIWRVFFWRESANSHASSLAGSGIVAIYQLVSSSNYIRVLHASISFDILGLLLSSVDRIVLGSLYKNVEEKRV